jgi:hypothetical protein
MLDRILRYYISPLSPQFIIQKLKLGNVYICSLSDDFKKNSNVFAGISCGASCSWNKAMVKALSEYVERRASNLLGIKSTTGFAAYPFIYRKKRAQVKARQNAYFEVVERYAWNEWFYNSDICYQLRNNVHKNNKSFYDGICNEVNIRKLYAICPKLEENRLKMVILYAVTDSGLACGGAVRQNEEKAEQNALKELYMHIVALYRMKSNNIQAKGNYEKRVFWISGQFDLLQKRLHSCGSQTICHPSPIVYQDIETEFHQVYVVQRCLFDGYDKEFISEDNEMYV